MVDFGMAFKRPFQDWKKYIIGTVLGIIPIVNFIFYGWLLEVIRTADKKELPAFDNLGDKFVKGLLAFIGVLVNGLVFAIVLGLLLWSKSFAAYLVFILLLFVAVFYIAGVFMRYAETYKFSEMFNVSAIASKAFKGKFVGALLVSSIIYMVIFSVVNAIISAIFSPGISYGFVADNLYLAILSALASSGITTVLLSYFGAVFIYTVLGQVWKEL